MHQTQKETSPDPCGVISKGTHMTCIIIRMPLAISQSLPILACFNHLVIRFQLSAQSLLRHYLDQAMTSSFPAETFCFANYDFFSDLIGCHCNVFLLCLLFQEGSVDSNFIQLSLFFSLKYAYFNFFTLHLGQVIIIIFLIIVTIKCSTNSRLGSIC